MKILLLAFSVLMFMSTCWCRDLIIGTSNNTHLAWKMEARYIGIPFIKRVKEFFFSDPRQHLIKGIVVKDLDHTNSTPSITAGGVGTSYANIRLKSQRSGGLHYEMEIYL